MGRKRGASAEAGFGDEGGGAIKLIIVRHGESIANSKGISQGNVDEWLDTPLTEKGIRQAKAVAKRLKDENIDMIISSDLKRARQTAEEINKFHSVEIKDDARLRDILSDEKLEDFISKCEFSFAEIKKLNKNIVIVGHGSSCLTLVALSAEDEEKAEGDTI